jgi:hypothetical protein
MPLVDRDEVLARNDLAELATEVCGIPHGRGAGRRWHCPNPNHPDEHPSMGVYRSTRGYQRWKCHACGEGGTAIDLLMISGGIGPGEALRDLARAAGLDPDPPGSGLLRWPTPLPPRPASPPPTPVAQQPDPAVEELVRRAAELLWQPIGDGARRHLRARGFNDLLLHANRVGFDPGPRHLPRPDGLPRRGPGIVYPALQPTTNTAIYYQLRYLNPKRAGRKYDQPRAHLAPNPHFTAVRGVMTDPGGLVVVCEGFPDALTAAHAGLPAVAVLGVSHASSHGARALAEQLARSHPGVAFAVYFDADEHGDRSATKLSAGRIAAGHLAANLAEMGAMVARMLPPPGHKDLNEWWQHDPDAVTTELTGTALLLAAPTVPAPDLHRTTAIHPDIPDTEVMTGIAT